MKKPDFLRGTGTVFRYTMQQHYKTTSVQVFLLILFILAVAAFPLIRLVHGSDAEVTETDIKRLYIRNETPFVISAEDIHADERYKDIEIEPTDSTVETLAKLLNEQQNSAAVIIAPSSLGVGFSLDTYFGENGHISYADADTLSDILNDALHTAMLHTLSITPEQEVTVSAKALSQVATVADYEAGTATEVDTGTHMFVNLAYSYIILILNALAMSYIFQFCMEEKVSKLVESLLVSVKPTALLVGKILAASCMIFLGIGLVAVGLFISYQIAKNTGDVSFISDFFREVFDFTFDDLQVGIGSLLLLIPCLLLAYAICACFSGIVGSCCSKTEDTQQASLAVVLFLMVGYMAGSLTPAMESDAVNYFCALFPLTSIFTALPDFLCGKIGLPMFVLALLLQVVTVLILARLAGAVYRMMLLYRGNVPKPKELFRMLRENRAPKSGKEDAHEA